MDSFSVACFVAKKLATKQSTTKLPFTLALVVRGNYYQAILKLLWRGLVNSNTIFCNVKNDCKRSSI